MAKEIDSGQIVGNASLETAKVPLKFIQKAPFFSNALGNGLIWSIITNFLTFYWTDVLLIAPLTVSSFLMITKLWDAFNDPIIGYLADKTQTRWGRYRPWILAFIPAAIFGFLTFYTIPGMSQGAKGIWSMVMYFLYVLAFTAMEVPGQSLLAAITTDIKSRGSAATFRMTGSYLSSVLIAAIIMPMVLALGGTNPDGAPNMEKGFGLVALIFTIISVPLMMWLFMGVRERVHIPVSKHSLGESLRSLKGNLPFWIFFSAFFIYGITVSTNGIRIYYWTYLRGYMEGGGINISFWLGGMFVGSIIYNQIVKRVKSKATPIVIGYIITGLFNLIMAFFFLTPETSDAVVNFYTFFTVLCGISQGVAVTAMYGVMPDITEYTQYKYNIRISGFIVSILNCSYKWGFAIGSAIFVAVIGVLGYVPNEAQSETVKLAINIGLHWIPTACFIVSGLIMTRYKINNKKFDDMLTEIAQRTDSE